MSNAKPPWWRWYEPPRWFPNWLHMRTCTFCRGIVRYCREQERAWRREEREASRG
jgi:hypothetical protein